MLNYGRRRAGGEGGVNDDDNFKVTNFRRFQPCRLKTLVRGSARQEFFSPEQILISQIRFSLPTTRMDRSGS